MLLDPLNILQPSFVAILEMISASIWSPAKACVPSRLHRNTGKSNRPCQQQIKIGRPQERISSQRSPLITVFRLRANNALNSQKPRNPKIATFKRATSSRSF
jgi:hypothetical protein